MDKQERDELEAAAKAAFSERWCLHPNGTSVWTGEEYQPDPNQGAPQYMVCKQVNPIDEIEVNRMEFIATCNPYAVLELLEFYGLSDTRIERGHEDNDEVCAACGYATTGGHTHAECFANGKSDGACDENLRCSDRLGQMLGFGFPGFFDDALKEAALLREDALLLARALKDRGIGLSDEELASFRRVTGD